EVVGSKSMGARQRVTAKRNWSIRWRSEMRVVKAECLPDHRPPVRQSLTAQLLPRQGGLVHSCHSFRSRHAFENELACRLANRVRCFAYLRRPVQQADYPQALSRRFAQSHLNLAPSTEPRAHRRWME